jgi:arylsulfatase A-like enzyme
MYKHTKLPLPSTYWQTFTDDYKELGWPEWVKQQRYSWHGVDFIFHKHTDIHEMVRRYCETLMGVDESVGLIMDYLKNEGLDKSTLVIYMGDNGFSWGEHGLIDKRHFYEESVKFPLLVSCPEIFQGSREESKMIQNIDIAPTVLEAAGLVKPEYMPGDSFLRLLKGDTACWRDKIFYEYFWEYDFPMTPTVFGVRTNQFKYIRYFGIWDSNELYDIVNDPEEKINLIQKPEFQSVASEMAGELFDWLEKTGGMQIPLKRIISHPFGDYRHPCQY